VTSPTEDGFDPARLEEAGQAALELGRMQANYDEGRDLVNQLLGQAQALHATGSFLQTFGVSKLAIVKEHKLYRQLAGMKTPNTFGVLKGTWEEFCGLLGMSDEKANQDIANLQAFGEAALEQMRLAGIGYRDLSRFRRLPADEKTALIEVAESGDKGAFIELAEEVIARHTKEKEALEKSVADTVADLEASRKHVQEVSEERTRLNEEVIRLQLKTGQKIVASDVDWSAAFEPLRDQIDLYRKQAEKNVEALLACRKKGFETLLENFPDGDTLAAAPEFEAALGGLAEQYDNALLLLEKKLARERQIFNQTLGGFGDGAAADTTDTTASE
jgi:hypothetical protein